MKRILLPLLFAAGAVAGAVQAPEKDSPGFRPDSQRVSDKQMWLRASAEEREAALAGQLERLGLAAAVAQFVRDGEHERALKLLDFAIIGSTDTAELLVQIGTQLPTPSPNLALGVQRTQKYARRYELHEAADRLAFIEENGFVADAPND